MLTKDVLRERLRELNVVPPADATSEELTVLLRRVKALKKQEAATVPAPRPRPKFTPPPVTTSPGDTLTRARLPISDHHRRPFDPMAGW